MDDIKRKPGRPSRSTENKERPARVSMNAGSKLVVPAHLKKEGYTQYWAITGPNHPGMLAQMEAAWWEFVIEDGERVEQQAGKGDTHVLMQIPTEYYDEDMQAQQQRNIDASQKNFQALGQDEYVPKGQNRVVEREII